jgi:hypothetical protein
MEPIQDDRPSELQTKSNAASDLDRRALRRCARRVRQLERGIADLLAAEAAGEMGNLQSALQHLRNLLARI